MLLSSPVTLSVHGAAALLAPPLPRPFEAFASGALFEKVSRQKSADPPAESRQQARHVLDYVRDLHF